MKKTATFLLIMLFATTLLYNAVDVYMARLSEREQNWIKSNENNDTSQFKVIKLNATLYSFIEDSDLEQVNETVIIDNKVYHIFKKQIKDNTLNLYYLGDENQSAIDISLKKFMDSHDNQDKSPVKKLLKSISKDYISYENKLVVFELKLLSKPTKQENPNEIVLSGFSTLNLPPPEFIG